MRRRTHHGLNRVRKMTANQQIIDAHNRMSCGIQCVEIFVYGTDGAIGELSASHVSADEFRRLARMGIVTVRPSTSVSHSGGIQMMR